MNSLKTKNVNFYFIFTLLFSWVIWIPLGISGVYVREFPWFYLMVIGGLSPSLMGLIFIIKNKVYNKQEFFKSFLSFKQIGIKNFLLSVMAILIPFGVSQLIDYLIFGNIPATKQLVVMFSSPMSILFAVLSFIYGGPLTEEFGWRGFATKILIDRYSLVKVSLIIGVIWSAWHYPLLFLNGQYHIENYFIYIPMHLVKHIALTVVITFFYQRTGKSVLSAMIIHGLSNMLVAFFTPVQFSANLIHTGLLLAVAIWLVLVERRHRGVK